MTIVACMGGWCRRRNSCQHYHAERSQAVSERLCEKGRDEPESMRDTRFDAWLAGATAEQVEAWKRSQQR